MHFLTFYVPESHLEQVKNALFLAGAGRIGEYDCCSWQTLGTGQYRPLPGSQPYEGKTNEISTVPEYKVEMVCEDEHLERVLEALKTAHPYETPAYTVIPVSKSR